MGISEVTVVHANNPEQLEKEINSAIDTIGDNDIVDIKITSVYNSKYNHAVYTAVIMY